ncbi:pyridoxal 5'-phosphate synthase glutaminase subunit PdxT [soil metagenome]|nr:pyridoxal 5'-phosphate synthase glutaminase subunit PdxT [Actinomycetota bacterium]MBA3629695.1 pyridoxal 5'-phosphate synthase glutaminase subunit PdxT [Actinomycetota bacterium]
MKIGVLGLQGDVAEHVAALETAGATPVVVRRVDELGSVDGLVIPGGESTTIGKLLARFGLLEPLRRRVQSGMPVLGTCAGLILMASDVIGAEDAPHRLGVLDVSVRRNAYGRQVDSFEAAIDVAGIDRPVQVAFIRAPAIERIGDGVEVLAEWEDRPVLVRQKHMLASSFHPEITGETAIHRAFVAVATQNRET